MRQIFNRLNELERISATLRLGTVDKVDYDGTASWNPKKYRPAALITIQDKKKVDSPASRVINVGAMNDSGLWWPLQEKQVVLLGFLKGFESPIILGSLWSDEQGDPPTEANENTVVLKWSNHKIILDKENGVTVESSDGNKVFLKDIIQLLHTTGTELEINADGDMTATVKGDLAATVDGDVDITAEGTASIYAKKGVTIKADTQITLETLGAIGGILTELTHPVCQLMGTPIGASKTVKGDA